MKPAEPMGPTQQRNKCFLAKDHRPSMHLILVPFVRPCILSNYFVGALYLFFQVCKFPGPEWSEVNEVDSFDI